MSTLDSQSADNPITQAHPLSALLVRVGFKFEMYIASPLPYVRRAYFHCNDENITAMMIYGDGVWAYEGKDVSFRRKMKVKTEQDLNKLLDGTVGGVYLRNYKLGVLAATIQQP